MSFAFLNARLVLHDEIVKGSIQCKGGTIASIDSGNHTVGEDLGNDYLVPGFIELHTDNFERHVIPRPFVQWPNPLAAALSHDAEIAAAGITTVFDSLCVGLPHGASEARQNMLEPMLAAVLRGQELAVFRAQHLLHFRCELTDPNLFNILRPVVATPTLSLVSLMDHTPGQRQWTDIDALRRFAGRSNISAKEFEQQIQQRIEIGHRHVADNRQRIVNEFRDSNITLASHDDTTLEHIQESVRDKVSIAEFPCSMHAARSAIDQGISVIGGAPNVVRGASHSGNVSMMDLARDDLLSGLSSDYVPSSLIQAAFTLVDQLDWSVPKAIRLISANPAAMVNLHDRGQLAEGRRADFVRLSIVDKTPVIKAVYVAGNRVL